MKKKIIIDASSVILLLKCDLFELVADHFELLSTNLVFDEIIDRLSEKEENFLSKIRFIDIEEKESGKLSAADNSLIKLLHNEQSWAILSEDGGILQHCKNYNITHYCSLSLLSEMVKINALEFEEASALFQIVKQNGRYASWVVTFARKLLDETRGTIQHICNC